MFDRFIRLARAKKALREQRFEDALQLALDPLIAADRRAETVRVAAGEALLERANKRLLAGDLTAARAAAERVRAAGDVRAAVDVLAAIDGAAAGGLRAQQEARAVLGDARRAVDAGDLAKADALLASVPPSGVPAEHRQLEVLIAERRRQAAAFAAEAAADLAGGAVDAALERCARAELLDRDCPPLMSLRAALATTAGAKVAAGVRERLAARDVAGALSCWRAGTAPLAAMRSFGPLAEVQAELVAELLAAYRSTGTIAAAVALARAAQDAGLPAPPAAAALVDALLAVGPQLRPPAAAGAIETGAVAVVLAAAARAAGAHALAAEADGWAGVAVAQEEQLAAARSLIDRGALDAARALLGQFVTAQPLHEGARRELDLVDQGLADLDRRLVDVRAALRSGRLRQACTVALALGGSARVAAEAQQIVAEARARMALVDRGLDEVRVALHGRAAATQEGVRHCLRRLEELAKVQLDHDELPQVIAAVQAEIEALGVLERAAIALERRALPEVLAAFAELLPARTTLLAPDRLDARLCEAADRCARLVEVALAAGRLVDVEQAAEAFVPLEVVRSDFAARAAQWRAAAAARREAALQAVAGAGTRLAERDLAEAERLVEQALAQWNECAEARALAGELRTVRQQTDALERVEVMTKERDFLGAQQKLTAMHAASPLLRTRIYDMKQNLARAQGLEGAFLLRVDEGGEQLVLRGESVTIGNVRQLRADLPVLANLAGRHASIRRSMSFHGGMQDTIVAEEGEVRVGGSQVTTRPLAPGDRVQLGPALGFVYQRPTGRSLTVGLVLQSGFQVAGTDRVLLMKDRGRDGRILLGPGQDVHVRVAKATGEVELFTTNTGQMRVACASGGTIDGVPFRGEHPLAAGQIVVAAGVSLVLLPWRPAA